MRLLLLLVPVALAALLLFLLRDDSDPRRTERAEGPERWEHSESGDGADEQTRRDENDATRSATGAAIRSRKGRSNAATSKLRVTILDDARAPRSGISIVLTEGGLSVESQETDAKGVARFSRSRVNSAAVFVQPPRPFRRIKIGEWKKSARTERITAQLYGPRDVLLHVRVDGQPIVPEGFSLTPRRLAARTVNPERGTIRGRLMTLTRDVSLGFKLKPPLLAETPAIQLREVRGSLEGEIDLARGANVSLYAKRPHGAAEDLCVETRQEDGTWSAPFGWADRPLAAPGSKPYYVTFLIKPGHHRLVLYTLRLPVQEFTIHAGTRYNRLDLNPKKAQWLRVWVNLPQDYGTPDKAGALITGPDVASGAKVSVRGRLLIPGDRELGLSAFGPGLRPHPTLGTRRVLRDAEVRLTAIGSGIAFLRCPGANEVRLELSVGSDPRRTVYSRVAGTKSGRFEFKQIPRGRFDVALIPKGSAGSTILNVAFDGESIDLGTIATGKGATVEIRIKKIGRGEDVGISADWLRFGDRIDVAPRSMGEGRWILSPLPAGKIRLNVRAGERTWQRLIETKINGKVKVELE